MKDNLLCFYSRCYGFRRRRRRRHSILSYRLEKVCFWWFECRCCDYHRSSSIFDRRHNFDAIVVRIKSISIGFVGTMSSSSVFFEWWGRKRRQNACVVIFDLVAFVALLLLLFFFLNRVLIFVDGAIRILWNRFGGFTSGCRYWGGGW